MRTGAAPSGAWPGPQGSGYGQTYSRRRSERPVLAEAPAEVYLVRRWFEALLLRRRPNLGVKAIDVSERGLRAMVLTEIPPGRRVKVVVHLPSFGDRFEALARVVWCRKRASGRFLAGLEFLHIPDGHIARLRNLRSLRRPRT